MEIVKGEIKYTISERVHDWNVISHLSDTVRLNFEISKELCPTVEELEQYILDNEMFAG